MSTNQKFGIYNGKINYDYTTKSMNTNSMDIIAIANVVEVDENISLLRLENNAFIRYINSNQYVVPIIETNANAQ